MQRDRAPNVIEHQSTLPYHPSSTGLCAPLAMSEGLQEQACQHNQSASRCLANLHITIAAWNITTAGKRRA